MLSPILSLAKTLERRFRVLTFAGTLAPTVGALGVQLVAFAITARGLGLEPFGAYTALLAVAVIGVELVGLGGADLLVRAVAHDRASFPRYFGNLLVLAGLTLPLVVAGGVALVVFVMGTSLDLAHAAALLCGEILVGRAAASLELMMVAHRQTVAAGMVRLATASLRLALAATFFVVLGLSELERWIEAAFLQSVATAAVYGAIAVQLYGRPRVRLLRGELRSGLAFCINQAARSSQGSFDRIILSRFADEATVGIYGAASRVLALGLFPLQVVTRITYPNFFVHGKDGLHASRSYALKIAPAMLGVGLAASAAVALAGYLAPLVLGAEFGAMSGITAALGLGLPLIALQYPAADALTGAGLQGIRAGLFLVATAGFGLAMAFGAWIDGIHGLVIAFLVSHGVFAAVLWAVAFLAPDRRLSAERRRDALDRDAS